MPSKMAGCIWKCKIPLKIKFFLWQVFNNKLQVGQSLSRRGWKGDSSCCVCGAIETVDHILFGCVLAKMFWAILREVFCLTWVLRNLKEFSKDWLQGKGPLPPKLLMFLFAAFMWSLWVTRNKMAIKKFFPKAPTDVMYTALSLIQKWMVLLKEDDRWRICQVKDQVLVWMRNFKPSSSMPTDVVEL